MREPKILLISVAFKLTFKVSSIKFKLKFVNLLIWCYGIYSNHLGNMCSSHILLVQLEIVGTSDPNATKIFYKVKKKRISGMLNVL